MKLQKNLLTILVTTLLATNSFASNGQMVYAPAKYLCSSDSSYKTTTCVQNTSSIFPNKVVINEYLMVGPNTPFYITNIKLPTDGNHPALAYFRGTLYGNLISIGSIGSGFKPYDNTSPPHWNKPQQMNYEACSYPERNPDPDVTYCTMLTL